MVANEHGFKIWGLRTHDDDMGRCITITSPSREFIYNLANSLFHAYECEKVHNPYSRKTDDGEEYWMLDIDFKDVEMAIWKLSCNSEQ